MVNRYVAGSAAALAVALASCGLPPPLPAGAPQVSAEVVCFEDRQAPGPPFGDGSTYRLYFWQFWSDKAAGFRHVDDAYGGTIDHPQVTAGVKAWVKASRGWSLYWSGAPGAEALVFSTGGPPNPAAVPRCTWNVPPI